MTEQSFRNQFLVALPALRGEYFEDAVTLLVDHNDEGAFGLIVNRPIKTPIEELFPDLQGTFTCPVLEGGPVAQDHVFFLHEPGGEFKSTFAVSDEIALTTSADFIDAMKAGEAPARTLAVLGYAGWGSGQLEGELKEDVWLLSPASGLITFDVPFEDRQHAAAAALGINLDDLNLMSPSPGHD